MIFNFSKKFQFATRLQMNNTLLEIVDETKLLGLIVNKNLTWRQNTDSIVTKANMRLCIIRKLSSFSVPLKDLVMLYGQFVRSILEFNSNVWFSSITAEEEEDIERVQKNACKLILKDNYIDYKQALSVLNLENLKERRERLAKKFADSCLKIPEMKTLFEENNQTDYELRNSERYKVNFAKSQRYYKSTIPTFQRLLNK